MQTGSGAILAHYLVSTMVSFLGGKVAGAEADQSPPSIAKVVRSGSYLHSYAVMACTGTALALD